MTAFGDLTPKQNLFLAALLQGRTIEKAATEAGIAPRTAYNYLKLPHVKQAYRDGRMALVDRALAKLQIAAEVAAHRILLNLQDNPGPNVARSRVQLQAAEIVLRIALDSIGIAALAARVDELEQMMQEQGYELRRGAHGRIQRIT